MSSGAWLTVAADLHNLDRACGFVVDTARSLGVAPEAFFKLRLAVDEVVTNIIEHGYQGRPGEIEIGVERTGDALRICLRDTAPLFDPTATPPLDLNVPLEQHASSGWGLHLVRTIMDELIYRVMPGGGNELTLVKRGVVSEAGQEAAIDLPGSCASGKASGRTCA